MNEKETEIRTKIEMLKNELSSNNSEIGDYKITKIYEARLKGEKDPYDFSDLISERDSVRAQINELQSELNKLEAE